MGKRREVPRRTDAPLGGNDGVDARLEEGEETVHDQRAAARMAEGKRVGPQEEHRADHVPG